MRYLVCMSQRLRVKNTLRSLSFASVSNSSLTSLVVTSQRISVRGSFYKANISLTMLYRLSH
uniref:Uncharacterized protein n=1 Tax=Octopus bimaculoides TaxID=37653 RepID=A0A0L8HZ93_OCTBM